MLSTDDFERMIVESFADDTRLPDSVDALLGHLLSGVPGYSGRSTDGVILEHSRIDGRRASASGVVVMIEQTEAPRRDSRRTYCRPPLEGILSPRRRRMAP